MFGFRRNTCLEIALAAMWCALHAHAATGFEVRDIFGREVTTRGLVLVDWEGLIANPVIKFLVKPPPNVVFPATATLTANSARLYFDLPCSVGAGGPAKTISFANATASVPVLLSVFPDRDSADEDYTLSLRLNSGAMTSSVPVHVVDQDVAAVSPFHVTVDFSRDRTGFFANAARRAIVQQAADDWAYFIGDMQLDTVFAGTESTFIWNTNGFVSGQFVNNAAPYTGFLLYAYGIHSAELRSGGEPSFNGGFQHADGAALPLKRSGGYEAETAGNYNVLGWFLTQSDDDWWRAGNLGNETNDLYSIAHHEIGHALFFNPAHTLFGNAKTAGAITAPAVVAYHGAGVKIDAFDHFSGELDNASRKGAFGYEYYGNVPAKRWLITKLDLLAAQAIGYALRPTSAFAPLALSTNAPAAAALTLPYLFTLLATGGVPFYFWQITTGALPPGLTLDSFTGSISGTPLATGTFDFTVRVRDYSETAPGVSNVFRITVGPAPAFRFASDTAQYSDGVFRGQLLGTSGQVQIVQVSTNLSNWVSFRTNLLGLPTFDFADTNLARFPQRYFRALVQP